MLLFLTVGCRFDTPPAEDVAVAAAVINRAFHGAASQAQEEGGPTAGGGRIRGEPGTSRTANRWSGEIVAEVTWGGDPEGACACRGDCASSRWAFEGSVDAWVWEHAELGDCVRSDGSDVTGLIPVTALSGEMEGAGGLGPFADDLECLATWPDQDSRGRLESGGRSFDVVVVDDVDGHIDVTVDGESFTWSYDCGG